MTSKSYESGDINLTGIKLGKLRPGETRNVDLKGQVISINIYEDIDQPSMLLELTLVDSINLVQDFPITGEEIVIISFNTPGRENQTKKGFLIYSIDGTGASPSGRGSVYTIKAVTPIHYFSTGSKVEKSYNDTIDNMVADIVKTYTIQSNLKLTRLNVEKTKGIVPITIPGLHPFQAIDMLRQKAISAEFPSGGSFVFFENQYGIHFKSVEGLLKEGKDSITTKVFTYAPDTKSDKSRTQYAFRNILRFNHLGKFDTVDKVSSGVVKNEVSAFDIHSKSIETTVFNLGEKAKTFTATDKKAKLPNSTAFIEDNSKNTAKTFFVPKDTSKGNDYIDSLLGSKQAFTTLLNQNAVRVLINGDSYLAAGDLVELNLPEVSGTTEKKTKDTLNSGNYLITKLRHMITTEEGNKPKHQIAMDCVRMGYK
jgi:hypothetical protein